MNTSLRGTGVRSGWFDRIANKLGPLNSRRTYRVGIAGGSCSGKTTFAVALQTALEPLTCEIVPLDRFMLHERGPSIRLSDGTDFPNNNHPDSTDNAAALKAFDAVEADVAIVEGLMALHLEDVRSRVDLKLFVDADLDLRSVRRMLRSLEKRPDLTPEFIGRYFLECAVPGHWEFVEPSRRHADLVVRGDGDMERLARLVASLIRAERAKG